MKVTFIVPAERYNESLSVLNYLNI